MNLVTVARVQRNPTVKAEIKQKNFEASIPVGFFYISDQSGSRYHCVSSNSRTSRRRSDADGRAVQRDRTQV